MGKTVTNYISFGDLIDAYQLLRQKGLRFALAGLRVMGKDRVASKWDQFDYSSSDFWVIGEVQKQWNKKCTGDAELDYETYVCKKHLKGLSGLKLLSVGCGFSSHEQAFSRSGCFSRIDGIDISEKQLELARRDAESNNCHNIFFRQADFETEVIAENSYDVILFHSSLHHFKSVEKIISEKTLPVLKQNGLLIICEYTGPDRLQWTSAQLEKINALLKQIPPHRRMFDKSRQVKRKAYRPGIWRTFLSDPSESADSGSILKVIHKYFETLEEQKLGGTLLHPLLKGIAHHFTDASAETTALLERLFKEDEEFVKHRNSDFTFGIYRKR